MASADDSLVMANKQSKTVMAALSCSRAVDTEIIDLTAFLKITEETGIVTSGIIGNALDGMSIANKNTTEGGNRGKGGSAEIQIIVQNEDFSL
ncbi:hypothetical protein DXB46_04065 [Lachnospiraceae bacterium OM04-12BH]|nr:hypothetical protein DXB46_04065 [Lachnospiraceae bacterium OM04-12BH]